MHRHLVEISDVSKDDAWRLFAMADDGPQPRALAGRTYLSAFFQESTRTRLGFMSAAARQGAAVLDIGAVEQLRREPPEDQRLVLAGVADIVAVRHWDPTFGRALAALDRCWVVNAGAGAASHPTQALVDAYTLTKTFSRDLTGLHALFLGPLLRSAVSFQQLAELLGVRVSQHAVRTAERSSCEAAVRSADVVYIQSLSEVDYARPHLNSGHEGPALPSWLIDAIVDAGTKVMHALPRGPELPDSLMWCERSLVAGQIAHGLPVRSAILRWLLAPT